MNSSYAAFINATPKDYDVPVDIIARKNPSKRKSRKQVCLLVFVSAMLLLILCCVGTCIYLVLESTHMKSQIASIPKNNFSGIEQQQQQLNANIGSLELLMQNLSSTIDAFHQQVQQNYSTVNERLLQLQNMQIQTVSSCADLPPSSRSGYYWLRPGSGSDVVRVYCDMELSCGGDAGGWMRVAKLNMSDTNEQCLPGLAERNYSNLRTCARPEEEGGCTSLNFTSNSVPYTRVCGKIIAYQYAIVDAYRRYYESGQTLTLEDFYAIGVLLTRGHPRQHIWTFIGARDELVTHSWSGCPCLRPGFAAPPPPYIGNDYFCDSGSREHLETDRFYGDDPLWDGEGCESIRGFDNTCCTFNTPPWFYKQLAGPTTDDVEMRVCRGALFHSDVAIVTVELYVK